VTSALGDLAAVKEILKRHTLHTSSQVVYPEEAYDEYYDPDTNPPTLITKSGKEISENDVLLSEDDAEEKAFSGISWAIKKPLIDIDNSLIQERTPYIRAETTQGYTALTYAVVGGHQDIIKRLIVHSKNNLRDRIYRLMSSQISNEVERLDFAKRKALYLTYDFMNSVDKSGWAAINYAVSFSPDCISEAEMEERIKIMELFINLGAKNNIVQVWEGDINILGLASKYGHHQLVHKMLYLFFTKIQKSSPLLHNFFGDYFKESIKENIEILEKRIKNKEEKGTKDLELSNYIKTLHILRTWKKHCKTKFEE